MMSGAFNDVGRGRGREGGVKKCFLSLRQTALLAAEGKKKQLYTIVTFDMRYSTSYADPAELKM
jgi:hypothetical protein